MNDEIKEILEFKEDADYKRISVDEIDILKKYITSLEYEIQELYNKLQENKELKAKLEMYENGVYYSSENDKLQDRIDKAIEYIEKQTYDEDGKYLGYPDLIDDEHILKILKGDKYERY